MNWKALSAIYQFIDKNWNIKDNLILITATTISFLNVDSHVDIMWIEKIESHDSLLQTETSTALS